MDMDDQFDVADWDEGEAALKDVKRTSSDVTPNIVSPAAAEITEGVGIAPKQYWVRPEFIQKTKKDSYLIVGFDTEYQAIHDYVDAATVREGKAKYEPLSYQFYAIHQDGTTWSGIALPPDGERMSLSDFIVFVLAKGARHCERSPQNIILVGHFNKADLPAFTERKTILRSLTNIRNSFVSRNAPIRLRLQFNEEGEGSIDLSIYVRDTMLLAPAGKKSLAELGKLIGIEKVRLAEDAQDETLIKQNMKVLREGDWETFREYAVADAEISAKYFQQVTATYQRETGSKFVPTSLSAIGMKLLVMGWGEEASSIVGREDVVEEVYDDTKGHIVTIKSTPYLEEVNWHINFVTECYHGGRNEQFWFGPSFEDRWTDYDLKGAYPTAMAVIGRPNWDAVREAELHELTHDTLGFACVDFKFPPGTRYPTLPVRSQNGIIFPLEGRSYCASPEIALALSLGCELRLRRAIIVPQDKSELVFFPFISEAIQRRQDAQSDIEKAFWKECANSVYGKTAQGLNDKRVFSLKLKQNERIPESRITNPFYSAYITSFVRAVMGEVMNALPADTMVFSVTTDGFITNASNEQVAWAQASPLSHAFSAARNKLTGDRTVLEKKHQVRQLLGWRTRGQATLVPDSGPPVLAKAGIKPPMHASETAEQNQYIVETFFNRTANSTIEMDFFTSVREMVIYDADLVKKRQVRRSSMEFDFKRKPISAVMAEVDVPNIGRVEHLAFDTAPWSSLSEFNQVRKARDHYWKAFKYCLKTVEDFAEFAGFFDMMEQLGPQFGKYLRKINGPLNRLRRDLCRAFKQGQAGLARHQDLTAQQFADTLNRSGMEAMGVRTKRSDVENGLNSPFIEKATPPTAQAMAIVAALESELPGLDRSALLAPLPPEGIALFKATQTLTPFTARLIGSPETKKPTKRRRRKVAQ